MLNGLKRDARTTVIAVIAASLVTAAPAAAAIVANAHKVDGKHAVSATATKSARAGKLVATGKTGYLPNNIITKAPNADKLDGLNSTAFATTAGRTGYVSGTGEWSDLNEDGIADDAIFAFATCPAGSQLTGGGQVDVTSTGYVALSAPLGGNTWGVAVFADTTDLASDVEAYAVCYNPRGAVSGGSATRMTVGSDPRELLKRQLAGSDNRR